MRTGHEFSRGRFTGAVTCRLCGLLPLDYDDYVSDCPGSH